jgi:hypothetical protein
MMIYLQFYAPKQYCSQIDSAKTISKILLVIERFTPEAKFTITRKVIDTSISSILKVLQYNRKDAPPREPIIDLGFMLWMSSKKPRIGFKIKLAAHHIYPKSDYPNHLSLEFHDDCLTKEQAIQLGHEIYEVMGANRVNIYDFNVMNSELSVLWSELRNGTNAFYKKWAEGEVILKQKGFE